MAPCLLGLFSVISLIYHEHLKRHKATICDRPCYNQKRTDLQRRDRDRASAVLGGNSSCNSLTSARRAKTCRPNFTNSCSIIFVRLCDLPGLPSRATQNVDRVVIRADAKSASESDSAPRENHQNIGRSRVSSGPLCLTIQPRSVLTGCRQRPTAAADCRSLRDGKRSLDAGDRRAHLQQITAGCR